jgi:peptide deformylase
VPAREVLRYPHAILKSPASRVEPGPEALALAADLVDTMRASPACVGIAAPQIGVSARAFCLDVGGHRRAKTDHGLTVMMNAVVVERSGRDVLREGCMSLPDLTANVARAERITVEGDAPDGAPLRIVAEGFEARAFQHEIDHLDGLLFLDRVSSLTADVFPRKRYDPSR